MATSPSSAAHDSRCFEPAPVELATLSELADPARILPALREVDWSFHSDDTGYLSHDIHPYPAKFIPQIPRTLIAALSLRGELVWDPFGGSGTTALEALLAGRRAISTDANPIAELIAGAKCSALSPEQRDTLKALLERIDTLLSDRAADRLLDAARSQAQHLIPDIPSLTKWFSPEPLRELAFLRREITAMADPDAARFAAVALSAVVVNASNQDSETRYSCRPKGHERGAVLRLFVKALKRSLDDHEPLERLLAYRRAITATVDARNLDTSPAAPQRESVDLVVTSPPYANATDYHLYHRFRLFWLGFDPRALAGAEIGSHLRHQREQRGFELYREEMRACLLGIYSRLRPGRYAAFILGDSLFNGEIIRTAEILTNDAVEIGFERIGTIDRTVHATRRSFIPNARRLGIEQVVVVRRPPRPLRVTFVPPTYRLWPYEAQLRRREIEAQLSVAPRQKGGGLEAVIDPYRVDRAQRLALTSKVRDAGGSEWVTWQSLLENGDGARRDPKYLTHGIHAYKGKFYPQLAKCLLNCGGVSSGAHVLDPFCGSGTVLLEGQLNGCSTVGFDMNPLAVTISRAKTSVAVENAFVLDKALKAFADEISDDRAGSDDLDRYAPGLRTEMLSWFPTPVARRIAWLRTSIERVPNSTSQLVLTVLLSSLVREVSQQEPADLRIRRRKEPLKDAPVVDLLRGRIRNFRERLRHFAVRVSAAPHPFHPAQVCERDSTAVGADLRLNGKGFDCVVTSPPYATALPYIDTDRLSLLALFDLPGTVRAVLEHDLTGSREIAQRERRELEARLEGDLAGELGSRAAARVIKRIFALNSRTEVGFRRRNMAALLVRYYAAMANCLRNLARATNPGAWLFFVIGDNITEAGGLDVLIPSTKALAEMGCSLGWELEDQIPITVTKEARLNSHHAITRNDILCFRAPG